MTKVKEFVRLDFVTVKPYFTIKNMFIYVVTALFLTIVSENISSAIGVGMMLGTLFIGYPFALSEKSNMDALYATLSVNRKTVVSGRYVFMLILNMCTTLFSLAIAIVGLFIANLFGFGTGTGDSFWVVIILAALFIVIQSIQLPMYFKFGYSKAKIFILVPFIAIMISSFLLIPMANVSSTLPKFFIDLYSSGMVIPLLIIVLLLIIFISYRLSFAFYKKREF